MNDAKPASRGDEMRMLLPYFVPYFLWVGAAYLNKLDPNAVYIVYPLKTILVAIVLICLRKHFPELRWKCSIHGVWVGLLALAVWLVPYWKLHPQIPSPDMEKGFDPLQFSDNPVLMVSLIVFRISGASLVVPFIEELLFRSCIARLVIGETHERDFKSIPVGTFTWSSLWITTAAFTIGHQQWEWIGAILVGLLYHWLVIWRKNILDCIIAHAVTNLGLGLWVLWTKQWWWW